MTCSLWINTQTPRIRTANGFREITLNQSMSLANLFPAAFKWKQTQNRCRWLEWAVLIRATGRSRNDCASAPAKDPFPSGLFGRENSHEAAIRFGQRLKRVQTSADGNWRSSNASFSFPLVLPLPFRHEHYSVVLRQCSFVSFGHQSRNRDRGYTLLSSKDLGAMSRIDSNTQRPTLLFGKHFRVTEELYK